MRLVTRGDLDGLTAAVILTLVEPIESILLIHPQDITDKRIEVTSNDVLANVPYDPRCGLWFDHHLLTDSNEKPPAEFQGRYAIAPSAARLVYDYYLERSPGAPRLLRLADLVAETDRLDAAQLTPDDVEHPRDYILLGYTIDSRTGLGGFEDYFFRLVEWLKTMSIAEVLEQPEGRERAERIFREHADFRRLLHPHSLLPPNHFLPHLPAPPPPPAS